MTAEVVTATFFGFGPTRTHRAIPDAWSIAPPAAVLAARDGAVLVALRSSVGGALDGDRLARAVALAEVALTGARWPGDRSPSRTPAFVRRVRRFVSVVSWWSRVP